MKTRNFNKGEIIFKQGEFAVTMYDIRGGKVGIFADYGTDKEKQLATFGSEEVFGEMGLIECYPRSATAVALEDDTQVEEITAEELSDYFRDKPAKVLLIMKQLSQRLRETTANYVEACRTVYETVEAEKAGKKKSNRLWERLMFFSRAYHNSVQGK